MTPTLSWLTILLVDTVLVFITLFFYVVCIVLFDIFLVENICEWYLIFVAWVIMGRNLSEMGNRSQSVLSRRTRRVHPLQGPRKYEGALTSTTRVVSSLLLQTLNMFFFSELCKHYWSPWTMLIGIVRCEWVDYSLQ
jgi:hypothetical protein